MTESNDTKDRHGDAALDHPRDALGHDLWELMEGDSDPAVTDAAREHLRNLARRAPRAAARPRWMWPAAAAAALVAAGVFLFSNDGADSSARTPGSTEDAAALLALDALGDDEWTALEIDGLEAVNQDWFGG